VDMRKPALTIIGAGLVGSLLATLLAQRGFSVQVFERRPDPRKHGFLGGRSINLALAERGWHGLRVAGLQERMRTIAVMMRGRMVHDLAGNTNLQRYGRDDSEVIWSVNRGDLNMALLDAAEAAGASIVFDQRLDGVDWQRSTLTLRDAQNIPRTHHAQILIGADGAGSALRAAMASMADLGERFEPLGHGYKELEIPALTDFPARQLPEHLREAAARGERFAMEANALHIWPRGNYMCIALPNAHGSFTVTLFLPNEGSTSFATIRNGVEAQALYARDFADALPLIPKLVHDLDANPTGMLATLYLDRWHLDGRVALIGDAAHAMSPVGGVGINLAIQDAVATANALALPLKEKRLAERDLEAVQRRRMLPTRMTQAAQVFVHERVLTPVLAGAGRAGGAIRPPLPVRLLARCSMLRGIPARLVGIGIRPEHVDRPTKAIVRASVN